MAATKKSLKNGNRAASNLIALIPFCLIRQMLVNFIAVELKKDCIKVQEKKNKVVFPSSTKREIRHFQVVVVQRRLRNVQKREHDARAKLLFC